MNWTRIRQQLGNRTAIVGAGVAGFLVGAGGFVAAQIDDNPSADDRLETEIEMEMETQSSVAAPSSTTGDTVSDDTVVTIADATPTSVDLTVPVVTVDDSSSSSVPSNTIDETTSDDSSSSSVPSNTIDDTTSDDNTSSSAPSNTIDDTTSDDNTSSSAPSNTIDDSTSSSAPSNTIDDSTSSSVPATLPAPFSESYQSAGGSISVTWTGTAFVLDAVNPGPGFTAEIEDQSWDRIRVDFEGDDDARIEVRLNDGQIRVRVG